MIVLANLAPGISPRSGRPFLRGEDRAGRVFWVIQDRQNPHSFELLLESHAGRAANIGEMEFLGRLKPGRSQRRGRRYLTGSGHWGRFWAMEGQASWRLRLDVMTNLSASSQRQIAGAGALKARPVIEARRALISMEKGEMR